MTYLHKHNGNCCVCFDMNSCESHSIRNYLTRTIFRRNDLGTMKVFGLGEKMPVYLQDIKMIKFHKLNPIKFGIYLPLKFKHNQIRLAMI